MVVGGGVIGLCTAYYALRKGLEVTVLERGEEDGDNCSMGNAGMIVPSHFIPLAAPGMVSKGLRWMLDPKSPFYVRPSLDFGLMRWGMIFLRHANARHVADSVELLRDLSMESRRLFAELAGEEEFGLVKRGLLMLCKSSKGLDEEAEVAEAARRIGIEAEVLDAKGVAALDPAVRMDVVGGVHFPQDCHLDPGRFVRSMRGRVLAMGGKIEYGVEVDGLERAGGRVSEASGSGRVFPADEFVVCGGSWSSRLLREVGMRLALQPGKGYSLTLESPPELPGICSILCEAKVAVTPMGGRLRVGGTMEVGAMDMRVNPKRVQGIVESIEGYFPAFSAETFEGVEPWVGLRPVSPDGLPYMGVVGGLENLHVCTGHAMMGLSLGPVSGRVMADMLVGEEPFRELGGVGVGRF